MTGVGMRGPRRDWASKSGSRTRLVVSWRPTKRLLLIALLVGVAVGVLLTLLESNPNWRKWTPSPTGLGIGMLVPGSAVCSMFVGAVIGELWRMARRRNYEQHAIPLASGLIAGEAIIATLIPIAVAAHIVHLQGE